MKETQAFLNVKRQQPQIKNFTNSDLDKLRSRLKAVYSKNILSFEHEKEFLDETASLIPDSLKTNHRLHLTMFTSSIRESTTSKSKAFLKFLQETLKDSSELFLYLTVYSAFQNLPYKKYTNDSDEKYLVDLEGSYISSHTIF
jgi:predicted O-linked N-acetylglucosamine transferase (SPINDLY family)